MYAAPGQQPVYPAAAAGYQQPVQQAPVQQAPPAPPQDIELKNRIDTFINYNVRNGPEFEAMLREKQKSNPDFAFLQGGPDHQYFQWRMWCLKNGWTEPQVQQQLDHYYPPHAIPAAPLAAVAAAAGTALTPELEAEFMQILGTINGSKDTIKNGRRWIVKHSLSQESRVAEIITSRMMALRGQPFETKLHLVYLLNDILHAFVKKREVASTVDPFAAGLGMHLLAIFDTACRGHSAEEQEKVVKVVRLWGKREIYPEAVVADLESKMCSPVPVPHYPGQPVPAAAPVAGAAPVPAAAPPQAHPQAYPPQAHPQAYPPAAYPHPQQPQGYAAPAFPQHAHPHAPRPGPVAGATAAPPTSTLHLGPGFLVTLTKGMPPYTPLDPMKVPTHIPPEFITPPDAYTLTRLDKFYEELNREARRKRRRSRSRSRSPRRRRSRSKSPAKNEPSKQFGAVPPPRF